MRLRHSHIMELIRVGEYKRRAPSFAVPEADLPIRENVTPGTWSVLPRLTPPHASHPFILIQL